MGIAVGGHRFVQDPSGGKHRAQPTDWARSGTRRSVLVEGHSVPLAGAKRHDMKFAGQTLKSIVIERPTRKHPKTCA